MGTQLQLEIYSLQRAILACIHKVVSFPDEPIVQFVWTRNRLIGHEGRRLGLWSSRRRKRFIAWAEHLERRANSNSCASELLHFSGRGCLHQRRLEQGSNPYGGRARTLNYVGHIAMRWHDGLARA